MQDLAEKWLKDCGNRAAVVDAVVKEQFIEVLPEEVRVWVKRGNLELLRRLVDWLKTTVRPGRWSCGPPLRKQVLRKECLFRRVATHADSRVTVITVVGDSW